MRRSEGEILGKLQSMSHFQSHHESKNVSKCTLTASNVSVDEMLSQAPTSSYGLSQPKCSTVKSDVLFSLLLRAVKM